MIKLLIVLGAICLIFIATLVCVGCAVVILNLISECIDLIDDLKDSIEWKNRKE